MNGAVSHFFLLHQRSVYVVLLFHVLEPFHSVASPAAVLALPSHNGAQVSPIPEVAASKPVLTSRQFASDPVVTAVHPNPAVALSISLGTLRPKSGSGFGNGVVVSRSMCHSPPTHINTLTPERSSIVECAYAVCWQNRRWGGVLVHWSVVVDCVPFITFHCSS